MRRGEAGRRCISGLNCYCFFSSRRRHTRCLSDWSSDVCSSDLDGLESTVIAVQSNVSDAGRWHESKNPLHHAETCAENRNEGQLLTTYVPSGGDLERGVYIARLEAQLTRRLVGHQHRDFVNQLLKMLRLGFLVAENRQLVLNKRMPDNSQRGEFLDALDHSRPLTAAPAPWTLTGS